MVRDIPIIPITEGVDFYEYNTKSITGWVNPKNPYAKPSPYEVPDWGSRPHPPRSPKGEA